MKYQPTVYRTLDDLTAAEQGRMLIRDGDGYLVEVKPKRKPKPRRTSTQPSK